MVDNWMKSGWQSVGAKDQRIFIDFTTRREFPARQINWLKDQYAENRRMVSKNWEKVYSVQSNRANISFIRLPEAEAKYLKIIFQKVVLKMVSGSGEKNSLDIKRFFTPNDFLIYGQKIHRLGIIRAISWNRHLTGPLPVLIMM